MFSPYQSSLIRANPDLGEVLEILSIAHKYCAHTIEERARPIAISMTHPRTIQLHINTRLSAMEIAEIGTSVDCKEVADSAFKVVMDQVKRKKVPAHKALSFAERIKVPRFIAEVYYQIMLFGSRGWEKDPDLTERQRRNLSRGSIKFVEDWDKIAQSWKDGLHDHECPFPGHRCGAEFLAKLTKHYVNRGIGSSDVLGRLGAIADFDLELDQRSFGHDFRNSRSTLVSSAHSRETRPVDDTPRHAREERVPAFSTVYESARPHFQSDASTELASPAHEDQSLPVASIGCSKAFKERASTRLCEIQDNLPDYFIDFAQHESTSVIDSPPAPKPVPSRVGQYLMSFWPPQHP